MEHNIILAGVGGQGILTIAKAISNAALAKGLNVKQAEVHGMSQRGGAVYSHLRLSECEIFSDVIPAGRADLVLAVEPLEALRYAPLLRENGAIVSSTHATVNIEAYPPIEDLLNRLAQRRHHIALDMDKLARAAGSTLATNIVALGAATPYLSFSFRELEEAVAAMFAAKGERVVEVNLRALRFGRRAAEAYRQGLARGLHPRSIRHWIETLPAEHLASDDELEPDETAVENMDALTGAEAHAIESILLDAYQEGRRTLYEHEVYALVEMIGAISPPRFTFVPKGSMVPPDLLAAFPGDRVVLKLVSQDLAHKSEAGAVRFVPKSTESVRAAIEDLLAPRSQPLDVAGVLIVEYVEHGRSGLGGELFVGVRATREFGPVIAAGLGGVETEYLASKMRPGIAVAKAVVMESDAESFLESFRQTAAYDLLAGNVRGHDRVVSDAELLRCFRAFYSIARKFCVSRGEEGPDIGELEVNPFAFSEDRMVPLDGRGTLQPAWEPDPPRDRKKVHKLLAPKTLAFVGVSAQAMNIGRTALANTLRMGFDPTRVRVVHPKADKIDGVACVKSIAALPFEIDLLVASVPSEAIPTLLEEANTHGRVASAILISGGAGETDATAEIGQKITGAIAAGRTASHGGTAILGPNGMGLRSPISMVDTFFIPEDKLAPPRSKSPQPLALLSQSGAFVVSRLSALNYLRPAYCLSFGNQSDITVSDLLHALHEKGDVQVAGVYLEGFRNLDGRETLKAIRAWTESGKEVIFYKAGRTEKGRAAAAGHTTALAGDYEITLAALEQAGAWVTKSFREFGDALQLSTMLRGRRREGSRTFAITNAGMEAVAMADAIPATDDGFTTLSPAEENSLKKILDAHGLGQLVSVRNPVDVTPMADESAYDAIVQWAIREAEFDAVIVSCVPLAPCLKTSAAEIQSPGSFAQYAKTWLSIGDTPIVLSLDAGSSYDPLAATIREAGIPVFRSADEAAAAFHRWQMLGG